MSAKQNRVYTHTEVLEIYEKLISEFPAIERKGKTMPYTSVNGHMFSFLDKNGKLSLRLPEANRNELIKKYDTELSVQHGRIMKEYVLVTEKLLNNSKNLESYFKDSHEYVSSLKPKATKKK